MNPKPETHPFSYSAARYADNLDEAVRLLNAGHEIPVAIVFAKTPTAGAARTSASETLTHISEEIEKAAVRHAELGEPARLSGSWLVGESEFFPQSGVLISPSGEETQMPPMEAKVLNALLNRSGQIVPRRDLVLGIWGDMKLSKYLNTLIHRIRRKLDPEKRHPPDRIIKTYGSNGYMIDKKLVRRRETHNSSGGNAQEG